MSLAALVLTALVCVAHATYTAHVLRGWRW